ncbi:VOC family protein [Nocardioides sp. KC13]|uniref:VOC family protein n=1 Tax=Nocardioides turkmenicus TaxID=2711220 RepID=A0A6M1QP41_9ACTN|nr:VOC family protein [Nocardioides sp. KC13]NGN91455.1 VOC family protein [Nocardioides sp. KC13]
MTPRRFGICIDANDPGRVAAFWAAVLDREIEIVGEEIGLLPRTDDDLRIRFLPTEVPKTLPNPHHLHLTSRLPDDQQRTVDRLIGLGARHLDVGQRPEEDHIVLGDPEGNELCVIPAGNGWLAGTEFLGEVAADGSRETGVFWSAALGWPLVWDQDGETAVATPSGSAKVAWGGPPPVPRGPRDRFRFDLIVPEDTEPADEIRRLEQVGARLVAELGGDGRWARMTDPDAYEFEVLAAR